MEHTIVYRDEEHYAGWPANYGIWSWDDEIVVGFTVGYPDPGGGFHTRDRNKPFTAMQARSLDGGHTWQVQETPCRVPGGRGLSADEHVHDGLSIDEILKQQPDALADSPGGIDFTHPDFALMCGRSGLTRGARSWFYVSNDRCKTWDGPFKLPMFGQPGIAARTDYQVMGPGDCILFLTAAKSDGTEGRVFCARTTDGGKTFDFQSWIGPEPDGFAIMPASLRLSSGRILAALRCRDGKQSGNRNWIDLYSSDDEGITWDYVGQPVPSTGVGGNPPTLTRVGDQIALIYGYRDAPSGIRARLSDDGSSWSEEIILRDDGGNHDLGYPRTISRPDGHLVSVYYYNDQPDGERYIAATIWKP